MTILFHIEAHWRRASDVDRWADTLLTAAPRFPFALSREFDYSLCALSSSPAAVGGPQR